MSMTDKLIIGAGLYGLYAALHCAEKGERVTVLELDAEPFSRATYVNQARVHMGYHYPRSLSTAMKSAGYFKRFVEDYSFCIHSGFRQVYATSKHFSWTDAEEFRKFCRDAGIPCEPLPVDRYFQEGVCDGAFLTMEYTYDAHILRDYFLAKLERHSGVRLLCGRDIRRIVKRSKCYEVYALYQGREEHYEAPFVLNATYASVNQVLGLIEEGAGEERRKLREAEPFGIKYELCEIILCRVSDELKGVGLTVMDGPFFSIMPFGKTGYHSLTSVTFTPHRTSRGSVPEFPCMTGGACCSGAEAGHRIAGNGTAGMTEAGSGTAAVGKDVAGKDSAGTDAIGKDVAGKDSAGTDAIGKDVAGKDAAEKAVAGTAAAGKDAAEKDTAETAAAGTAAAGTRTCVSGGLWLGNCNLCGNRPESAWDYMAALARKYVREEFRFAYEKSLFSMKPILKAAELDDSRPTVVKYASRKPTFLSVLSGKINTVYDLDAFLDEG